MKHRVVITGIGVVVPCGVGPEKFWYHVGHGIPTADTISRFDTDGLPTRIACETKEFDPHNYLDRRLIRRLERCAQFAVSAAKLAQQDADIMIDAQTGRRTGVFEGTALGCINSNFERHREYLYDGVRHVSPLGLVTGMTGNASSCIAQEFHLQGPSITLSNGCVSSSYAVGCAFRKIQYGEIDVAFAGGAEAPISREMLVLFSKTDLLSKQNDDPTGACKPFDTRRDGFVLGEGGAILIIEQLKHAAKRNARIYAEIVGFGETTDAYHPTRPEPGGEMIAQAMRYALAEAHIQPHEVDYLNAHGTATVFNDPVETRTIKKVFGDHASHLPISSLKPITGHLLGACGVVEVVASVLAIKHKWIPPTANLQQPDPQCDLDCVPKSGRSSDVRVAVSNNYSFGGRNASLVFREFR